MKTVTTKYQTIYWNIDSLEKVLLKENSKKLMFVVDSSFQFLDIKDVVERIQTPSIFFSDFTPNPIYEDVCKGIDLFNSEQCDTIIAIGGGSSIDVAKCIKLFSKMDKRYNYLQQECFDSHIPLIAIPTTAGTGSESTRFSVIYYEGKKQSINHVSIIPNYAILDSSVLLTLPVYQKKCTVLDAFCQGIESWWSVNSTEESILLSRKAVEILTEAIIPYIQAEKSEDDYRLILDKVMMAANLAGQAINITQTTAPHAFSYKITSLFKIPHGHAVAICLPEIWQYMIENMSLCKDCRGVGYLENIFAQISDVLCCDSAQDAVMYFRNLLGALDIRFPVSNNRKDDINTLVASVNPIRLKNNPVLLDERAITVLYEKIIQSKI